MNVLTDRIVHEARKYVGVREQGRNDGPEIRAWLKRVKRQPPAPWCAAFAWSMLDDAIKALDLTNPVEPVAGVHLFSHLAKECKAWTAEPGPGFIFFIDKGRGKDGARLGHCGIVVEVGPLHLTTIEGNTDGEGGRDGDGVYLKTRRINECTLGFLDPGLLLAGQTCHA